MKVWGVLVAAGSGQRFGARKQLAALGGRPVWEWSRQALIDGGVAHVVVVGEEAGGIPGGSRRRDSVAAGLARIPVEAEFVLVHDAVRPLASSALVRRVTERLLAGDVDGVVPVVPVGDTVKRVAGDRVVETFPRDDLMAVQTPQGFRVQALRAAQTASDEDAGDEAELIERAGGVVATVPGEPSNLKITYPGDLERAEALL